MSTITTTEPTGLDQYARFDPSISRMRIRHFEHVPSFETVYVRLLMWNPEVAEFARAHVEGKGLQDAMKATDHLKTVEELKREAA